jgi:hypothetical protein
MQNSSHNRTSSVSRLLEAAKKMPLLAHYHQGRPFDIMRSEAVDWLINQPEIRQMCWNTCKPALVLDIKTGKWCGNGDR